MSNKKQTAVQWLKDNFSYVTSGNITMEYLIDQAKEMEKQQIIEFGKKMQLVRDVDFDGNIEFIFNAEQYYNKTYETE
jgi:hypothetical protein